MIVSSETLARLRKRTCSPGPSLITYVVSTSRLFTKYPGTSSAPRKLISCSGSIVNKIKQSIPTHRRHRRVSLNPLDVLSENKSLCHLKHATSMLDSR